MRTILQVNKEKSGYRFRICISLFFIGALAVSTSCQSSQDNSALQVQVDRLQHQLDSVYKPGLGEFMSGIQMHHEKLWFAGTASNWKLAGFELGEINEAMDDIGEYCRDRPEVTSLPMIRPPLDSIGAAVKAGSETAFKSAFVLLTNSCNSCHRVTRHEFNVIKVPDTPSFTNQVFTRQ